MREWFWTIAPEIQMVIIALAVMTLKEVMGWMRARVGRFTRALARREEILNEPICGDCPSPMKCCVKLCQKKAARTALVPNRSA